MKKYPKLEVRMSRIHRHGVFVKALILKGERVIQYTGRRLTTAQSNRSQSDYLFTLNSRTVIDGRNTARYINHSCHPNCETEIDHGRIWIIALRDIRPGQELSYNYGYDLKESKDYPCGCKTRRCVGYIADERHWSKIKNAKKKLKG